MARFSLIERRSDSDLSFVAEPALIEVKYEASVLGFIRTLSFTVDNAQRATPQLASGTHTGSNNSSSTLTDSEAAFKAAQVRSGDRVVNTTDSSAVWEVVTVDSSTQLTVQLVTSGGGDDDFDTSDAYTIQRRNAEDAYVPFTTEIRMTGRDVSKVLFRGVVQEAIADKDQGRYLRVIAVSRDSEARDGAPQSNISSAARSAVIQDALDQQDSGRWLFPKVSSWDGEPGLDHSPNLDTVEPDFSNTARSALSSILDLAKSERWCPEATREPSNPVESFNSTAGEEELGSAAQGDLAQSFQVSSHMLLSKVKLRLRKVGSPTGNAYVRIEANDEAGDSSGNDVPSGELVTPWAESTLVNISGITGTSGGELISFVFNQPVALRSSATYWIVISYQEDNHTVNSGMDYIAWQKDTSNGYTTGTQATYSGTTWSADTSEDFSFEIWEHTDAVYLYDKSGDSWSDFTTEAATNDVSRFSWMGATVNDRMYLRFAGPVRGFDLLLENTLASDEYGDFTVRYYSDDGAKMVGEHNGSANANTLKDTDKDFRRSGIVVGDVVHNKVDGSYGVITAIAEDTLTAVLQGGSDDDWDEGDTYSVVNLESRVTGTHDNMSSSATVLTDSTADFRRDGVREGDLVINTTDNTVGVITAYTDTTITASSGGMGWDSGDEYEVLSRWRTLTLLDTDQTFVVANTVRFEWEIPSDMFPTFIEAGKPEASSPGVTDVEDMRGFWLTVECASIPSTRAEVDLVTPIPGSGFVFFVTDQTHSDVILAAGGAHDGSASAASLQDSGEDFIGDHGVLIGDVVDNLTDGSSGTVTDITTTTNQNDTLVATLSGGTDDDWDSGDVYRIRRNRFRTRYFRHGSRPVGLPANFGLTFRQGSLRSKQIWQLTGAELSQSTRSTVNRVRVVGRPSSGVNEVVNNQRAQREVGRVISKTVVDYSVNSTQEAQDRGNAELARLSDRSRRAVAKVYGFPFYVKTLERQNWFESGTGLLHKLDGSGSGTEYEHDGSNGASSLQDSSQNFAKWGVEAGDLVTNITDDSEAEVTAVSTTTNQNDTLEGTLSGGTDDDWDSSDEYRVEQRNYVQVGDLVRVKVDDPDYVDADYMVVRIKYHEPSYVCELRLAQNLIAPAVGDQMSPEEIWYNMKDEGRMALQRGLY